MSGMLTTNVLSFTTSVDHVQSVLPVALKGDKIQYKINICGWQLQKIVDITKQLNFSPCISLKMLEGREKQKQEEAKAKELRKQERQLKRKQKEEEKQREKEEREQKKKLKELKMKKKRKSGETSSSESDVDVPYMDSDIDDFIYDDDLAGSCHGCHLSNGDPGDWIGCDECARWWHVKCTGQPDVQGLNHAELGDVSFKCKLC